MAPEIGNRLDRLDTIERRTADDRRARATLAGLPMADSALLRVNRRALRGLAATGWEACAVTEDADVPGRNVGLSDRLAEPWSLRSGKACGESQPGDRNKCPKRRHA